MNGCYDEIMRLNRDKFLAIATETLTFLWGSREGLSFSRGCLSKDHNGEWKGRTKELAERCSFWLSERHPGLPLDTVEEWRDKTWRKRSDRNLDDEVSLLQILQDLSSQFVSKRNGRFSLPLHYEVDSSHPIPCASLLELREAWGHLTSLSSPDLYLAASASSQREQDVPQSGWVCSPSLSTPEIERVLLRGSSDTHVHLGSFVAFPVVWQTVMRYAWYNYNKKGESVRSGITSQGLAPEQSCSNMPFFLLVAAFTRLMLSSFLWGSPPRSMAIAEFLRESLPSLWSDLTFLTSTRQMVRRVVESLERGEFEEDPDLYRNVSFLVMSLHRHYSPSTGLTALPHSTEEVLVDLAGMDPLRPMAPQPLRQGSDPIEFGLLLHSLRYLEGEGRGKKDGLFPILFWQYVRIKNLFYKYFVTSHSHTPGFLSFSKAYYRGKLWRDFTKRRILYSILPLLREWRYLETLELRTNPGRRWSDQKKEIVSLLDLCNAVLRNTEQDERAERETGIVPRMAFIFHFIKGDEPVLRRRGSSSFPHRYGRKFCQYKQEMENLLHLLITNPSLSFFIRGIDVANRELTLPTWVFAPIYLGFRSRWRETPKWRDNSLPSPYPDPGYTVHCGEDFRDLVQGLRRIHEAVQYLYLEPGDRLGHCMALGTDPEGWLRVNSVTLLPKEEYLDNLVWEYMLYCEGLLVDDDGTSAWIENRIINIAREIGYLDDSLPFDFLDAYRNRHAPTSLFRLGFPTSRLDPGERPRWKKLLFNYLTSREIYGRGREVMRVIEDPTRRLRRLVRMQELVSREISKKGLVVETCPTSNIFIGGLGSFERHPIFRLQPPLTLAENSSNFRVTTTVNTDNPLTFNTCLESEFANLYFAAVEHGVTSHESYRWLDQIREQGRRSSFVPPRDPVSLSAVWDPEVTRSVYRAIRNGVIGCPQPEMRRCN